MQELIINPDFKQLIPPLSQDEYSQLEQNIVGEGCREPLITWNDTIIDGHNRYEICTKHDILFNVIEKDFEDDTDAKIWIIKNQFGRRNLQKIDRILLASELEPLLQRKARQNEINMGRLGAKITNEKLYSEKENERGLTILSNPVSIFSDENEVDSENNDNEESNQSDTESQIIETSVNFTPINVREELAKMADVSEGTFVKVKKIKEIAPDVIDKIRSGDMSINKAYKSLDKREKLEKRKSDILQELSETVSNDPPIITIADYRDYLQTIEDNSIDLLITDPPYSTDIEDIEGFVQDWVPLALQKVKDIGRALIFIGAYPKEMLAYLDILSKQDRFIVDNSLIWTYKNTLGVTPRMKYNLNYQVILHLYSKNSRPLNTDITAEMFSVQEFNAPDGRLGNRFHTWQKPIELAERLIRHTTERGEKVLDIFTCTGTFLLAATKLGRIGIGCEINRENASIAESMGCQIV